MLVYLASLVRVLALQRQKCLRLRTLRCLERRRGESSESLLSSISYRPLSLVSPPPLLPSSMCSTFFLPASLDPWLPLEEEGFKAKR